MVNYPHTDMSPSGQALSYRDRATEADDAGFFAPERLPPLGKGARVVKFSQHLYTLAKRQWRRVFRLRLRIPFLWMNDATVNPSGARATNASCNAPL